MSGIGLRKHAAGTFDEVLARIPAALQAQGFGVLTRIDVQETLRQKIGAAFRRYQILGACNPGYAHRALDVEPAAGALLPCSVAVWEEDDGSVTVNAVDPMQTIAAAEPALAPIAAEVRGALARALDAI